jgi:putative proteasome-type protease
MTYCLGMKLHTGMVFVSDSRTNAGVDNVGRFEKMRIFQKPGERVIVTLSAGNLSTTQSVLSMIEHLARKDSNVLGFYNATSMFEVAGAVGNALREVNKRDGEYLRNAKIDASASFIVGGQIQGEGPRLFHVYSEGNFIETSRETCYFQIGEIKYGKPILDRVASADLSMSDAIKLALISFDSTMRANIGVGPPLDLVTVPCDTFAIGVNRHLEEEDPYLSLVRQGWSDGLRKVYNGIPAPAWSEPVSDPPHQDLRPSDAAAPAIALRAT